MRISCARLPTGKHAPSERQRIERIAAALCYLLREFTGHDHSALQWVEAFQGCSLTPSFDDDELAWLGDEALTRDELILQAKSVYAQLTNAQWVMLGIDEVSTK